MTDIALLFKNRKVNFDKLIPFGFTENSKGYFYCSNLFDGQFELRVFIKKTGELSANIIERDSGEEYVLHLISGGGGSFVGRVREEYEDILNAIDAACFESDVFKSDCAQQVIHYVRKTYGDELQFLWKRFPENAIFRRQDNRKWYAALLTVAKGKLGIGGTGKIEIIDLRMKTEKIKILVDRKNIFPGYHMNKNHWITICLDGSVSTKTIFELIDESFLLTVK